MNLPKFKCKICSKKVVPFTESKHLKDVHGIIVNKTSDLARNYEAYY